MFESYFRSLYENILGPYLEDYFENLDNKNVSISLWSDLVILTDLKIRTTVFKKLNMPFILKLGVIKRLEIQVPYARISSSPLVAKIDEIYLVISP